MTLRSAILGVGTFTAGILLAGCGQHAAIDKPTVTAVKGVSGHVHGGQNPISGATIQLWQINITTDGGLGTPLLTHTVTSSDGSGATNSNANAGNALNTLPAGDFTITGAYTCPVGDALVYITASGGNPGLSPGTNNPQSQMVTALGSCNALKTSVQFININEQTTVATVASLYAFMSDYNAIGASPAHAADIVAAFKQTNEYADFQAGTAPGPALPAGYSASTGDLNLLANVLAGCVNSVGGAWNDGSPCGTLFYNASASSTNPSTDVTAAALYIRKNYRNVATASIASLPTPQAPFQPASTAAPADWTLPIYQLPSTPTFSLSPGSYAGTQTLRILDADPTAIIYYTIGDVPPTSYESAYFSPLTINESETVNAVAVVGNGPGKVRATSAISSASYTITGVPTNVPFVELMPISSISSGSTTPIQITAEYYPSGVAEGTPIDTVVTFVASDTIGGSFSPATCTITVSICSVMYIPTGSAPAGTYANGITASFSASSGNTSANATGEIYITPPVTLTPFADPSQPLGSLIQASDGNFYGVQQSPTGVAGQGQIFRMDTSGNITPVYTFTDSADGLSVLGPLVQGTDGFFYGVAQQGGSSGNGTLFKVDASGNLTLLYSFTGGIDGASPSRGLVQGTDGSFYGTSSMGGAHGYGTVFRIDAAGNFTLLHAFAAGTDGAFPWGGLVQGVDGNFYGMTDGGGTYDRGTVFKMNSSGDVTTLYAFTGGADGSGTNGFAPFGGGLVQATDGNFYGTTNIGGTDLSGTLFKLDTSGNLTVVHTFTRFEVDFVASLVEGSDGALYGTSATAGAYRYGALYKVDLAGNFALLYSFQGGSDGSDPSPSLVQGADGSFYGSNTGDSTISPGVVFKLTPSPALTGPITLTLPASVTHGTSFNLAFTVANASSATMQQCFATNTAGDLSGWTGIKTATTSATNASLFAPLIPGTYTYSLTCGGIESGFATLNVN